MADKENKNQKVSGNDSKPVTRYDKRKLRKQLEEQEKKKKRVTITLIALLVVAVCAGVGIWKGYRSYQEKFGPYVKIGSHKIDKKEFNYYYNSAFSNFYSQYGSYASYFGLDVSQSLDQQSYSDTMTWKDYFEQQAVSQLQNTYALTDEASSASFEYDASDDVDSYVKNITDQAEEEGESAEEYVQSIFGSGMTLDDVKEYVSRSSLASAYYENVSDNTEITDEEVNTYYEENKNDYDSVDYLLCDIAADMPEEETEEATEDEAVQEDIESEEADESEETETEEETLSEEEQAALEEEEARKQEEFEAAEEAARAEAKSKADEMLAKVTDEDSFNAAAAEYGTNADEDTIHTAEGYSDISSSEVADWLFDSDRKAGDATAIRDDSNDTSYVVYFKDRYLEHKPTVDVRHILIQPEDTDDDADEASGTEETEELSEEEQAAKEAEEEAKTQAAKDAAKEEAERIYKEWQDGEATEDSFAALAEEYSTDTGSASDGGLYEAVTEGQMVEAFNDWIFDSSRKSGDTGIVETGYGYHIMYFVGQNKESWEADIRSTILDEKMSEYMDDILEKETVSDPLGHINYLKVKETETESETDTGTETGSETETETES